jgi:hypothetical protein
MLKVPSDWLLEGEPWVAYRTRLDLLGQDEDEPRVTEARHAMLADSGIKDLLAGLSDWPGRIISSHKSAGQPFHKLTFIADLGFKTSDDGMKVIISRILQHQFPEGPFQLPTNIPTHFGSTGLDQWAWALCDAPLIVYALAKFSLQDNPVVRAAASYLAGLARDNGWPCAFSKELGEFRGPGRKDDPCPFTTLAMLKVLSVLEDWHGNPASHAGAEALLSLWSESTARHPYMFYMGTDFRKLKAPFVWYDLLHVLDVLTRFTWLRDDPRVRSMLDLLASKADHRGRFTSESIWTAWKGWEFNQKKEPSRWLSLIAWRILQKMHINSL